MGLLIKNKKWLIIGLVIFFILLLLSSGKDKNGTISTTLETKKDGPPLTPMNPHPRGSRLMGMGISEGGVGFEKAFALAQSVGVKVVEVPVPWDDYEPNPGQYVGGWLPIANQYYPTAGIKIAISLNPIDTNNLRLPKDLKKKLFNDPEVIERYKSFVDFVASTMTDSDIFFVAIGNEIDAYLGNSDERWKEYAEFFSSVAPHVRTKFPHAAIGSKITFEGIFNLDNKVNPLINDADVVLTTYYPFKSRGFIVRDPATVHEDFKHIVERYPKKEIYFAEIGYPSGELNGSSETKQAEFIHETFAAWDTYTTKIPFLNFQWMHDASPETVADWQRYYGLKDKGFASYLATLGLRTYDGRDKQAFIQFSKEVKDRGW